MAEPLEEGTPPTPKPEVKGKAITCEFCKCSLAPDGNYLRMSDEAKKMRDNAELLERAENNLAVAKAEIARLQVPAKQEETSRPKWPGF